MRIGLVSLFPELLSDALKWGVIGRAAERGLWQSQTFSPRDFAPLPYRKVDDRPYGGGPGMVMLHEPLSAAICAAKSWCGAQSQVAPDAQSAPKVHTVLLSPSGARFDQAAARRLGSIEHFVLVCGRYEGIDARTVESEISEELSLGDFVLSGGEFAALAVIDAIVRLLPGALGDAQSAVQESFSFGMLDHPHYTRPESLADGRAVPPVLLSGDHQKVGRWRREQALTLTFRLRPDLLATTSHLSSEDLAFLRKLGYTE